MTISKIHAIHRCYVNMFRPKAVVHWDIIEKETVDEIIFRTDNARNRLILELMARGGMRVGEVLKLTPNDILDRKLILNDTKSGKEQEFSVLADGAVVDSKQGTDFFLLIVTVTIT